MLSKFKFHFNPSEEMQSIYARLVEDIKFAKDDQGKLVKSRASKLVEENLIALENVFKHVQKRYFENRTNDKAALVKDFIQEIGYSRFSNDTVLTTIADLIIILSHIKPVLKKSQPFECLYIRLNAIFERSRYLQEKVKKDAKKQPDLFDNQVKIIRMLIQEVIFPLVDDNFKKMTHCYRYEQQEEAIVVFFQFNDKILPQMKCYQRAIDETDKILYLIRQNTEAFINNNDLIDLFYEFTDATQKLDVFRGLLSVLLPPEFDNDQELFVNNIEERMPIIKLIFEFADEAKQIITDLQTMNAKLRRILAALEKSTLPQFNQARSVSKTKSETMSAASAVAIVQNTAADTATTQEVSIAEQSSSLSLLPEASNDDPEIEYDFSWSKAKREDSSREATPSIAENRIAIKGNTARKVILKVLADEGKIKYDDLITLVNAMNGSVDEKTGSSSRKLHFPNETVFLHKRHGRDRAQYADPKVVKQVKKVLITLGVSSDNLSYVSLSSTQTRRCRI